MMTIYSLALTLGFVLSSPWWLLRMATTQRYREGLRERLGFVPASLRAAAAGKRVLWLHAVSVGEVLAATRLVSELEAALGEGWIIAISTTTRTGQTLARERFGADRVFYMPLDFAFSIRAYLHALKPAAIILMESELWPRLLDEAQRRNIPTVVANARMSDRSFARAMKFKALWSRVLRKATLFLAQSEQDAERLTAIGITNVRSIGNLKYDAQPPKESWIAEKIRQHAQGRTVIVAGSTVSANEEEDVLVMRAWRDIARTQFNALLVIAPRHPENFQAVYARSHEYRALLASDLTRGATAEESFTTSGRGGDGFPTEVMILDTIGDLARVYSIADVAFVGGTLVSAGGHNPLEPARFGVPTVIGPSFENFREIVSRMKDVSALRVVQDDYALGETFANLLENPDEARAMGERGRQVFESQQGATARAVEALLAVLPKQVQS